MIGSPRVFVHVISLEARKLLSYRADFWINTLLGFLAEFGVYLFVALALFGESGSDRVGPFALPDLILWYVSVLLIAKVVRGPLFSEAESEDIYQGHLTRYLLLPAPYVALKYAQHLGALVPLLLQAVIFGVVAVFVLDPPVTLHVTPFTVAAGVGSCLLANLLYYLMRLPLRFVAFWQDNVWSLAVALRMVTGLLGGVMLPLALFPRWAQDVLAWSPFPLLFDWPARTLLGQVDVGTWCRQAAMALAWCAALGWLSQVIWRRGTRQYTGVGI